jgi:cytochrome c biogenesis protein CcmG/thiol:disulfide interchange protein DsbE
MILDTRIKITLLFAAVYFVFMSVAAAAAVPATGGESSGQPAGTPISQPATTATRAPASTTTSQPASTTASQPIGTTTSQPASTTTSQPTTTSKPASTPAARPVVGSPAPGFKLSDTGGKAVSLSDFKGHAVMLNFWATWCGPCREEIPFLQGVYADPAWQDKGLEVVAIDIQEEGETVQQFQQAHGMTYRVLLDTEGRVANQYNISGIPTTFFIDKDGIIMYVKLGTFARREDIETILSKTILKE